MDRRRADRRRAARQCFRRRLDPTAARLRGNMADGSKIEWCDATWQPITGCSVVSPGCTNCYAMRLAGTRLRDHWSRRALTRDSKAGPVWTGEVRFNEQWL